MAVKKKTPESKLCRGCGETKPASDFGRRAGAQSHLFRGSCRACEVRTALAYQARKPEVKTAANQRYAARNREKLAAKAREYYWKHPDQCRAGAREWAAKNPEKKRATDAVWRAANADRKRANDAAWHANNPERARATRRAWSRKNRDAVNARNAARRAAYPERQRAYELKWQKSHPQTMLAAVHRRRARLAGAPGTLTKRDIEEAREVACGLCAYCLRPTRKLTLDHVIPISKGGAHDASNIVMACRPCNSKKNARGPLSMLSKGANRCHL